MRRVFRISLLLAAFVALVITMAGGWMFAHRPIERTDVFEHPFLPKVQIRVSLVRAQERDAARYIAAVKTALRHYGEWFGALEGATVHIASAEAAGDVAQPDTLIVDAGLVTAAAAGRVEHRIALALAARQWRVQDAADDADFRRAVAEFVASRTIRTDFAEGPFVEVRAFNGLVPWVTHSVRRGPSAHASRLTSALATLERFVGWSALQPVLAALHERDLGQRLTPVALVRLAEELTGRDLAWAGQLFDPAVDYDFAVERLRVERMAADTYRSTISVRQRGRGSFGPLALSIRFADGQGVIEQLTFDTPDVELVYDAGAPAVQVVIDPEHIMALDSSRANNVLSSETTRADAAARSWTMRWGIWLQDRLLLWSALI